MILEFTYECSLRKLPILSLTLFSNPGLGAKWFSALAAMAMLSAKTRVQVPPNAQWSSSSVARFINNRTPTLRSAPHALIIKVKNYQGHTSSTKENPITF